MNNELIGKTIPLTYELLIEIGGAKNLKHSPVLCVCHSCGKEYYRTKNNLYKYTNGNINSKFFACSPICVKTITMGSDCHPKEIKCKQCGKNFLRKQSQIKKSKNNFCSRNCSAIYNNSHKSKGTRISKLEIYIQSKLIKLYPNIKFEFNSKEEIKSELDIYIPSLKLAFELNGIFHYEPIFGEKKLNQIALNDNNKFQKCIEKNISLCIIDTSQQKHFTEKSSQKYFDIIIEILNSVINTE